MIIDLGVELMISFPFNSTPTLLISIITLFNILIVMEGVNCVYCLYIVGRGALKGYMNT